jgi:hypothetical protein
MKHPQSCETCKHFWNDAPTRYAQCKKLNEQIDGEDIHFVSKIGCASYQSKRKTYPQKPGDPNPKVLYLISEGECEEILTVNENLPTDELELKVKDILFDVRTRKEKDTATIEMQPCKYVAGKLCQLCDDATCGFYRVVE